MKIENLVEKDTVLNDDYLIVDGTDGTKKAKKSTFLRELNSSFHAISEKKDIESSPTQRAYTGLQVTIPAKSFYCITARAIYANSNALWVGIGDSSTNAASCFVNANAGFNHASCSICGYAEEEKNFYIWAQWNSDNSNQAQAYGFYITQND